ncbi:MAG: hypothetical protein FH758_12950 [Firmicutes bacterium]|nr:hypothetical protein [Bacillota bacterium]
MGIINKEVENLLSTETFKTLIYSDIATIAQINAAISLLIKSGIDFDFTFSRGTNSLATQGQITIALTPTSSISITFAFEPGAGVFS